MNELQKELADLRSFVEFLKSDRVAQKAKEDSEKWTRWVSLTIVFLAVAAALANQQYGAFSGRAVRSLNHAAIAQGNATNKWSYYMSVSIKLHMYKFEKRRAKEDGKLRKALATLVSSGPSRGQLAGMGAPAKELESLTPEKVIEAAKVPDPGKKAEDGASGKPEKSAKKSKAGKPPQDAKAILEEKIAKYNKQKPEIMKEAGQLEAQVLAHSKDSEDAQRHTKALTLALAVLQVAIAIGSIAALAKKKPLWFISMVIGAYGLFETFNGIFMWV